MSIIRKEQLTNPLSASYALTASYALSANVTFDTSSLLITASATSNTITFTKGNGSTFPITVNTGSAATVDTSGFVTTASFNAFTSSINAFTASYATGSFSGSFTGSLNGTATTASYYQETDPIFVAKSASLATTGSNIFTGTQTITGSNGKLIYTGTTPGVGSNPTLAEVHANDEFPWLHRFYNDTFSTSSAVMAYYGWNDGRFVFHNESTQSIGLQVNGFNAENGLLVYEDKVAFVNNVEVTGSLNAVGGITGSLFGTASWAENARTASYVDNLNQNLTLSGSLTITQNLTVLGSQSVQYITSSQLDISTNIITVNTSTPAVRFGGLAVLDSGSFATGLTGSLLWDSQNNVWIYSNPSGAAYDGGLLLTGPRNSSGLGNEVGINSWYAALGNGSHHMTSSQIYNSGSLIKLETNTQITGSLVVSAGITGSLFGTSSWAQNARTSSYISSSNVYGPNGSNSVSYASTAGVAATAGYADNAGNATTATTATNITSPLTQNLTINGSFTNNIAYTDFDALITNHNNTGPGYGYSGEVFLSDSSADGFTIDKDCDLGSLLFSGNNTPTWTYVEAWKVDSTQMLGFRIADSANGGDGILTEGYIVLDGATILQPSIGAPLWFYQEDDGGGNPVPPPLPFRTSLNTGQSQFTIYQRLLGHLCYRNGTLWVLRFKPSNDWIQI
jgi:hypothetical protein